MTNLLKTSEAAERLRLSPRTLEKLRVNGGGPKFCKFGSAVLYLEEELAAWVAARLRSSTSDKGGE